jgi:Ser/Thr protein kinase RdoA (MazF antagonist)
MTPPVALVQHLGLEGSLAFHAQGATAEVWRLETSGVVYALRLTRADTPESARMAVDALIRTRALAAGARVAASLETGLWNEREFALDEWMGGEHVAQPSRAACVQLGETLRHIHALPCTGHGLLENRADALEGSAATPEAGVLTRLARPFPLSSLEDNALVRLAPQWKGTLCALESELLTVVRAPGVVCHTDLHAGQLLERDGNLAALLDFGDAAVVPAAWDIASFAYFHSWDATHTLLKGYGQDLSDAASRWCIILCLHHANKSASRQARAVERFVDTLSRLNRSGSAAP